MPMYETPIPIGGSALIAEDDDGETYELTVGTATFTRTGEDGAQIILPLFGGDEMIGDIVEGFWKKGWDAGMDADQAFTAILDNSGTLEFEGEADAAGVAGNGWINGHLPLPLLDELEIIVSMSVPVDDTGAVASRDIFFDFYLRRDEKAVDIPSSDADFIRVRFDVDETGLILIVSKEVATANTLLDSGYDYTMDGSRSTGDLEAVVWRFVFHNGVAGATAPSNVRHMHLYMKQSDTIANAESATENQLDDSPYDISDLLFNVAYPAFQIVSQNITYYDAGNEAKTTRITVDYPDFNIRYDIVDADRNKGEVELWDGDPDVATSQRVFDEDHVFNNDPYLQNGLTRIHIDEGVIQGIFLYSYFGAAWVKILTHHQFNLRDDSKFVSYPYLLSIVSVSPEKIIIRVRLTDTATNDTDYYIETLLTLERGKYYYTSEPAIISPEQTSYFNIFRAVQHRFGYAGNNAIGDDDLTLTGNNTTLSDNFVLIFDDAGPLVIPFFGTSKKPDDSPTRFQVFIGGIIYIQDYVGSTLITTKLCIGAYPFSLVANLFVESEDEPRGAATLVTDAAASPLAGANNAVQINAIGDYQVPNGEYSAYTFTAGTHLPEGRYKAIIRARYVDIETMEMYVWQDDDNEYRNEENAKVTKTLAVTFGYHSVVFDITASDVTNTRAFAIVAEKSTADTDEIRIDDVLVVPIGDGESFPQDLAHAALRTKTQSRRIFER